MGSFDTKAAGDGAAEPEEIETEELGLEDGGLGGTPADLVFPPAEPKPGTSTSAFKVVLVAMIAPVLSFLASFLVASGVVSPNLSEPLRQLLVNLGQIVTTASALGAAGVAGVYIHGRNKVSQIKAQASADFSSGSGHTGMRFGQAMGGGSLQMTLMFILPTLSGVAAMLEARGKKGKQVGKIIRTAVSALQEYMRNPD